MSAAQKTRSNSDMRAPERGKEVAAAPSGDDNLIALLDKARADLRAWQHAPADTAPTLASILAPKPWEATMHAAAMLPARTQQGIRAKAETVADWLAGSDRKTGPGFDCTRETAVAWSLMRDLLGAEEIAPVPPLRRPWAEEDEERTTSTMLAPVAPDASLIEACARYEEVLSEVEDIHARFPGLDTTQYPDDALGSLEALDEEGDRLVAILEAAEPTTSGGVLALARAVLLLHYDTFGEGDLWREKARDLCRVMLVKDPFIGRLDASYKRRWAELEAQKERAATLPPKPAPEPAPTPTPAEMVQSWRNSVESARGYLRYAEANLAAAEAVAS